MFEEKLSSLPQILHPVCPMPSHAHLEHLPEKERELTLTRAARAEQTPLSRILASDWLAFSRTGDRAHFEDLYFPRRRRLTDLVCGFLLKEDSRWLEEAVNTIWALCEESAWQLPAHNSYVRDAPQAPWPDVSRPVVDLFAAETGALLSCAAAVLADHLSQPVRDRIFLEVNRRILTPYLTEHFWWMGNGDEEMNNWTPWCTQNVLLCAFTLPFDETVRRRVIGQACRSLDCFLKDYGEDGCCSEGAQYYGHAALCLFSCLRIVELAAPGVFDSVWKEKKIANMASYIYHMHVDGIYYFNFADCSPVAGRRGARDYLFAVRTGNGEMASFAARDWLESLSDPQEDGDVMRISLWEQLLELDHAGEMAQYAERAGKNPPAAGALYPSNGVYTARRGVWQLAVKGGNNADSHNHNDVGSVILYRDGKPFLIDLGVETYCRKTFSPQRYEIWTMQSSYHNLPDFDGVMQCDGAAFRAREVQVSQPDGGFCVSMELSAAWPEQAGLESFWRVVTLLPEGLRLEDECRGSYRRADMHLLLQEKPEILGGGRIAAGALGEILCEGLTEAPRVEILSIQDARLRLAWPDTLYRLVLPFSDRLSIRIR